MSIDRLPVIEGALASCQPCVSPGWDTGLVSLALQEVARHDSDSSTRQALKSTLRWLAGKQLRDEPGD
jgi:squalene-hopene/tetraprenyl-beta-curcumene cyclase